MTNDSERLLDDTGWELLRALQENARLSYAELGKRVGLTTIMRFQSADRSEERTIALMKSCPEIIECHRVTGDDCMTLTAVVSSVEHLQALINKLAPHGASNTALVLSSPIQHRVIGPEALARAEEEASA